MSDSVWPHRRQPTRLPHPWDSPGKNTGVGCHFLLQCMKVKSESEVAQSCLTLSNPMDCSLPGSSIHGIFQARVLEWGAIGHPLMDALKKINKQKAFPFLIPWRNSSSPSQHTQHCLDFFSVLEATNPLFTSLLECICCYLQIGPPWTEIPYYRRL